MPDALPLVGQVTEVRHAHCASAARDPADNTLASRPEHSDQFGTASVLKPEEIARDVTHVKRGGKTGPTLLDFS